MKQNSIVSTLKEFSRVEHVKIGLKVKKDKRFIRIQSLACTLHLQVKINLSDSDKFSNLMAGNVVLIRSNIH